MLSPLDTHELAWAAGFFDGEGCIVLDARSERRACIRIQIGQVDRQVLDRFHRAVGGVGAVRGPYGRSQANRRPIWGYTADGFEKGQAVVAMLWKWLGPVKREQARQVLVRMRAVHEVMRTTCARGHPYDGFIRADGARSCRVCRALFDKGRPKRSRRAVTA